MQALTGYTLQVACKALELALVGLGCLSMWKQQLLDMQAWRTLRASTASSDEVGTSASAASNRHASFYVILHAVVSWYR